MDPDPGPALAGRFRISSTAWLIGLLSIALAVVAIVVTPGPAVQGCFHSKHCFPLPLSPLLYGGAVLLTGAALSTAVARIPRHWVVGWNITLAFIATLVIAGGPLLTRVIFPVFDAPIRPYLLERGTTVVTALSLMFVTLAVLNVVVGMLASALVGTPKLSPVSYVAGPDPRPQWQQEMEAVRAALQDSHRRSLGSSESQLVAELAYHMKGGELEVPTHLEHTGTQLLDLLTRDGDCLDVRGAVLGVLDRALSFARKHALPYRAV